MASNGINISTNKFVNADGSIDSRALQNIIQRLNEKIDNNVFNNFYGRVLELSIAKSGDNQIFSHGLNFTPNFAIISYIDPSTTTIVLNYQKFTNKIISLNANGVATVNILLGRLDE